MDSVEGSVARLEAATKPRLNRRGRSKEESFPGT
jgi:hypothetical protein